MKRPPFAATALLGPVFDLAGYAAAAAAGLSAGHSQIAGFLAALAFGCLPLLRMDLARSARRVDAALCVHALTVALLAFFLRSGVFEWLTSGCGWRGAAAIVPAALATAAVLGPGCRCLAAIPAWRPGCGRRWREVAAAIVIFSTALRLIYGAQVELMPEETYYWNYSRHLDIGYLDHPPMVGWLIRLGTAVFGNTEFGVRVGAMSCAVISSLFAYRLTRNLFGEASALIAVLLLQTLPFFFLTGMFMTPDAPLTAAWIAAAFYLERALIAGRGGAWWGAGLCLGLGMLSKYTIALLGLSALLFMLFDAPARRWLLRWQPYAAACLAFAVFSPVIFWNAQHEWASFAFQTSRRLAERPRFALHKLIASALVLLTPTGLAAAALAARRPCAATPPDRRSPRIGGAPGASFNSPCWCRSRCSRLFSLRHEVKLDWTGAPWIVAVPAMAFGIVHWGESAATGLRGWLRGAWSPTIATLLLLYGAGLYHLSTGIPGLGYGRHAELVPVGWRELGARIHTIAAGVAKSEGADPLIVGMDRYAIASELAFYAPDQNRSVGQTSSGHLFGQMGLMYERWFPPAAERGRSLLLVAWSREELEGDYLQASVERLEPIREGTLMRDGQIIRRYYYRLAHGYRGPPAAP